MDKPLYVTKPGLQPEKIASVLNSLYNEGYHLKEILPEKVAGSLDHLTWDWAPDAWQTYTILAVRD